MDRRSWHVGKEIPIAFLLVVFVQTGGFIWSISGLYSRVDAMVITINEMKLERYTKEDGRRDQMMAAQMYESQRQRDSEQDRRINNLEVVASQLVRGK